MVLADCKSELIHPFHQIFFTETSNDGHFGINDIADSARVSHRNGDHEPDSGDTIGIRGSTTEPSGAMN